MRGVLCLARAALASVIVLAPGVAAAVIPPPPVGDARTVVRLVSFAPPPASVACAGGPVRLLEGAAAPPRVWQAWVPPLGPSGVVSGAPAYVPPPPPASEVYGFSIDADGHPRDLKRRASPGGLGAWNTEEQVAILAGWRFAPGAAAPGCQVDLTPRSQPLAEASPAQLFEALANDPRNPPPALRKALEADGDCAAPSRRRPRMVAYPDTRPFDDKTVDPAWAGLRFDIDAAGVTREVRVVGQHGDPAFARAAARAVAKSRYFSGPARASCYVVFKAMPKSTDVPRREGPPMPDDEACKITREQLNLPEDKFFPPAYAKRRVGGRALLRFDVAPWGQIGAIEVLESQPTAAFGDAARLLLANARPKPQSTGHHGCVVPIIYAIPANPDVEN